jgi:alkanesulfonate monooxygenase SsuD/methylene tetrahydromethanopterin reductase-like flavin-dependent oxidoreductase (luciferase family)
MKLGLAVPQGWTGEYAGWDPRRAWERTVAVAIRAEALGFESAWVFDHFHTFPTATDEITFESFSTLAALGTVTSRIRLGHVVICAGFRNPALITKMICTMDVATGGRMHLGIGAGWNEDEWRAYGYGFPPARERLQALRDHLEVITAMMAPGRATHRGVYASVDGAVNVPKPMQQPRVPLMVGGNGPEVTWRLAARYADELNLDGLSPDRVRAALPVIAARCEELGRDPATLPVSVHVWTEAFSMEGAPRVELFEAYRDAGVCRVSGLIPEAVTSDEPLESLATDARAAGAELI